MRLALVGDTFPPLRTSGAVQLMDLSQELIRQGHDLTVMVPSAEQIETWRIEICEGVRVLRLRTMKIKDVNYLLRTVGESLMPHMMWRGLRKSPVAGTPWDGIICYAPSVFHGPLVRALKAQSRCRSYLIVRDIFPEWAADLGLMRRGLPYQYFKAIARDLYNTADCIGVQSEGNLAYFERWARGPGRKLEVLPNWLADRSNKGCSIRMADTPLAGRKVFVYAGNMGVAQDVGVFLDAAERLQSDPSIGFLFIGRGSDSGRLSQEATRRRLGNVVFRDEVDPDEIPGLLAQCTFGIVALNESHKSHNIPGKFLTYMHAGLPVLARVNPGNDIAELIRSNGVGRVVEGGGLEALMVQFREMARLNGSSLAAERSRILYERLFSPATVASRITAQIEMN